MPVLPKIGDKYEFQETQAFPLDMTLLTQKIYPLKFFSSNKYIYSFDDDAIIIYKNYYRHLISRD